MKQFLQGTTDLDKYGSATDIYQLLYKDIFVVDTGYENTPRRGQPI